MKSQIPLNFLMFLLLGFGSCGQGSVGTPKEYKYNVDVDANEYSKDSTRLYYTLETMLFKNLSPFSPSSYYDSTTRIYIDSILYSPDELRAVVFVINRVAKDKKKLSLKNNFEYNANYLFCDKVNKDSTIKVYRYSAFNLSKYGSYADVKNALFELCFGRRATDKWNEKQPRFNMDDSRFWNSEEFNYVVKNYPFISLENENMY
jgi:hypothetical protein